MGLPPVNDFTGLRRATPFPEPHPWAFVVLVDEDDASVLQRLLIHDIVWAINTTPRKCLGFLSPAEAFIHQLRCCT